MLSTLTLSGTWLGQDGHDLVALAANPAPDGVQDIHIALSGLPTDRTVTSAVVLPYGGGEWQYHGPPGSWAAGWVQAPGATNADLYVDPYMTETGRVFYVRATFNDNSTAEVYVPGGTADPNLRMPGASVAARWVGQDGQDLTGNGPAVGPDGIQDIHLALSNLSTAAAITSVSVISSSGASWQFGANLALAGNAELIPNAADASRADLYFNPANNLAGQTLTVQVNYDNTKSDRATLAAGATDPTLPMPLAASVALNWNVLGATWLGQDGWPSAPAGSVHLAVSGLPTGRTIASALLSDQVGGSWAFGPSPDPVAAPLVVRSSNTDPTRADLAFAPIRNELGATLTLRCTLDDGSIQLVRFAGGASDPGLRAPDIAATAIVAHPGDDLNALASAYGTVHLAAGTYSLGQPLVLNQPVTITADPGATLLFSQPAGASPWTAAIKIKFGHTTLNGFAVRFAGPVAWNESVNYGPTVIGVTDNLDPSPSGLLVDITISNLDLQSPPVPASAPLAEAPHLLRMVGAEGGLISKNVLKGGSSEFFGGPWQVTGNTYNGTVPNTTASSVFSFHYSHDLVVANNTAAPSGASGKTWRFLVLTQAGHGDLIQGNSIAGIGPMDNDTIPNPNAPEIILTEAYRLHFEGMPSRIAPDGLVVQIPGPQGGEARSGDVVSVLSGPGAGQWRSIAQTLGPNTYLLDAPLPAGIGAISIATGFVGETFQGNTVDARGSSTADDLVLAGNEYGARVLDNHFLGGARGIEIYATSTESPVLWGWSHAPVLGLIVQGNTLEDVVGTSIVSVNHGAPIKSNAGRVYLSGTISDNTVVWSGAFEAARARAGLSVPVALAIGELGSNDPGELVLSVSGNTAIGSAGALAVPTLQVTSATINAQAVASQAIQFSGSAIPAAPGGLHLVRDTGDNASDGLTADAHLGFNPVDGAVGYEYSIGGAEGSYLPGAVPSGFFPSGLAQGSDTVFVRAFDSLGRRGSTASLAFTYLSTPPLAVSGLTIAADGRVSFQGDGPGITYEYRLGGATAYLPLGTATTFHDPAILGGPRNMQIHAIDQAGNISPDTIALIPPRTVPLTAAVEPAAPATAPPTPAPIPTPVGGIGATTMGKIEATALGHPRGPRALRKPRLAPQAHHHGNGSRAVRRGGAHRPGGPARAAALSVR